MVLAGPSFRDAELERDALNCLQVAHLTMVSMVLKVFRGWDIVVGVEGAQVRTLSATRVISN